MNSIIPTVGPYPRINVKAVRETRGIPPIVPIAPLPRTIMKGIFDGGVITMWPVDASGSPHHSHQKYDNGINHPTVDFHVRADGTFAMWSKRGLQGDPTNAATLIEASTGLNWCGRSIEEEENKVDGHSGCPWMTTGAIARS